MFTFDAIRADKISALLQTINFTVDNALYVWECAPLMDAPERAPAGSTHWVPRFGECDGFACPTTTRR